MVRKSKTGNEKKNVGAKKKRKKSVEENENGEEKTADRDAIQKCLGVK